MKVDILSDPHIDIYFNPKMSLKKDTVKSIFDSIILSNGTREVGEVLIIAGDIGHYNTQNIELLKIFKSEYYKYIICVLGNHDYYLIDEKIKEQYSSNSFNRADELKKLINDEENIYCLDGDVVQIDGIKFGGAMGWYNNAYNDEYFHQSSKESINDIWKNSSNDSKLIYSKDIKYFEDIYKIEKPKLEAIYQKCDVMITHINPSYKHQHINSAYHNTKENAFFTFNGDQLLKDGSMKYWVFGHNHDEIEYDLHGVKCICNPMGYPNESQYGDWVWMKSFEI